MLYPKYYCPTRWIGIVKCLRSTLLSLTLLEAYVDKLVEDGWRPDRGTPDEEPEEAQHARVEEDDAERDVDARFHSAKFHSWDTNTKYWDLPITVLDDDFDIKDEVERFAMDS